MEPGQNRPDSEELLGPELSQGEIADIKTIFYSVVDSIGLRECCIDILYSNWMHFSAIIQRKNTADIIIQISNALTTESDDLRIRVELFKGDTRPGMTGLDYLKPMDVSDEQRLRDATARSVLFSANRKTLTTTLRKLLVKIKATLIHESRLTLEDIPGEEGRTDYALDEFDVLFVGQESLWANEAMSPSDAESETS